MLKQTLGLCWQNQVLLHFYLLIGGIATVHNMCEWGMGGAVLTCLIPFIAYGCALTWWKGRDKRAARRATKELLASWKRWDAMNSGDRAEPAPILSKLNLGPDDVLVVRTKRVLTETQRRSLCAYFEDALKNEAAKAMVLPADMDITVLSRSGGGAA